MAQSSSAQRDPSMEEILASIRKIIEEGEEPAARDQRDDYEPAAIGPAANDTSGPATITALPQRGDAAFGRDDAQQAVEVEALEVTQVSAAVHADDDLMLDDFDLGTDEVEMTADDVIADDAAAGYAADEISAAPALRGAIMSEAPVRQVKASFSELTEALAVSRRRSLDEVAEDVLRPMLQDWLDNNLPTLVERLVREEIERVARGG